MENVPYVACLCRSQVRSLGLIQNALACFDQQDYPAERRFLFILDDELPEQQGFNWIVIPSKEDPEERGYNYLLGWIMDRVENPPAILVPWDLSGVQLPWYLSAHLNALTEGGEREPEGWSAYEKQWVSGDSLYLLDTGETLPTPIALSFPFFQELGGWVTPHNNRQSLIRFQGAQEPSRPDKWRQPGYVHRLNPEGTEFPEKNGRIWPEMDRDARRLYDQLGGTRIEDQPSPVPPLIFPDLTIKAGNP